MYLKNKKKTKQTHPKQSPIPEPNIVLWQSLSAATEAFFDKISY